MLVASQVSLIFNEGSQLQLHPGILGNGSWEDNVSLMPRSALSSCFKYKEYLSQPPSVLCQHLEIMIHKQ